MMRHVIGMDLGTTNGALAVRSPEAADGEGRVVAIPQLTAVGTVAARPLLPSFLYLPAKGEFPPGGLALPWDGEEREAVGELARRQGVGTPTRLVASAKSWLCHAGVDRTGPLLPWQAPPDVERVSPVAASARYLRHLVSAARHGGDVGGNWDEVEVVLTVPASFDAAARELTLQAAREAGLERVTLLEEPQAALYAWLERTGDGFRKVLRPGDTVLVVDVGGGTTDFSLMAATDREGVLELTRIAVGDHILLGGDNMDLALAHEVQRGLTAAGRKLDAWQFTSLTHGAREAKERLFAEAGLDRAPIAIPGRGSALMGATVKAELTREQLERTLIEGFFPAVPVDEGPQTARRSGLTQVGLPYAQDAGITRHLASFLTRQRRALEGAADTPVRVEGRRFVHPTAVLFNGGVFRAGVLKARLLEVLNGWLEADGGAPAKELEGADLDLAVARGAAYYGWVRQGNGIRIRGGTARAYYVGVESPMPAVPGYEPPVKALCVAPFGMEEGTRADVPPQAFALVVGEPTQFRFFASSVRREDRVGDLIEDAAGDETFEELAPIETRLPAEPGREGQLVPVHLRAAVTEVGTLELECLEDGGAGRWRFELNVRLKGDA
ncbi:MAG: Hsp70 family protein [Verrucomicrobiae bacterium]|nr:Hsp70 family protein [Verrucomicrobiae bacterium]